MVLKNKKEHKIWHKSGVVVGEDKLSNLPDALIHHIFSFLPTKCVMSTCILSKRWKYVSRSIPTLDFHGWRASDIPEAEIRLRTQHFMNFLDTVLYSHERTKIRKFCLSWDHRFDDTRVFKWIGVVIMRKIEELYLSAGCIESSMFPRLPLFPLSLFTSDSLTVLDLDKTRLHVVPNTVFFPKLKILRLRRMENLKGESANKLFVNCPVLEELSFIQCSGFKSGVLCITNLSLKKLSISCCYFSESTVKICAPNLSTISYGLAVPADFVLDSFPSLVEADINICMGTKTPHVLVKLFEKLSKVKLLKMSSASFWVLRETNIFSTKFPVFHNLIHLQVSSNIECTRWGSDWTLQSFFKFLKRTPKLESIIFAQSIHIPARKSDDICWSLGPKYLMLYLRTIEFKKFNGDPMELNAIELFLKYAGFLKTAIIVAAAGLSNNYEKQTNVMKQLKMCPRPANCVVRFLTSSGNVEL